MKDRPYFLWDVEITDAELRERLRDPDPRIRAQWEGVIMREAPYPEVWGYLSLEVVLRDWSFLRKHLGRKRAFWEWLLKGWREDGFIPVPCPELPEVARTVEEVARDLGGEAAIKSAHRDFHRLDARRGDEVCIVDLVVDRAQMVEPEKASFGNVKVDTKREIAANKICTLVSRSEIKDLVDLWFLVRSGIDLHQAFADAQTKEGNAEPATLAWILDEMSIGPSARLPGGYDPAELDGFRKDFVRMLRSEAFKMARKR